MQLTIFGSTGVVGGAALLEAVRRGHHVTALVRRPGSARTAAGPGSAGTAAGSGSVTEVVGDALDRNAVRSALAGAHAVLHCVGVGGMGDGRPSTLVSESVRLTVDAMEDIGTTRLVCLSNIGAGGSGTALFRRAVLPVALRRLLPIIEDKDRMEAILTASSLDWTAVRLPNVVPGAPTSRLRISTDGTGLGLRLTTGSAASHLLDLAEHPGAALRTPSISG